MRQLTSTGRKAALPGLQGGPSRPELPLTSSTSSVVSVTELRRRTSVESMSMTNTGSSSSYDTDNAKNLQYVETLVSTCINLFLYKYLIFRYERIRNLYMYTTMIGELTCKCTI